MCLEVYFTFIASAFVLIIVPGPTNMVIVSSSMKHGFKSSIWTVAGAALSHTLFLSITCLGLAAVLLASAQIFEIIRWFGVLYLIWLGIKLLISKDTQFHTGNKPVKTSAHSLFLQGLTVNTTNPKALIFYSAFFPPFINPKLLVTPQLIILGSTFIMIFLIVALFHGYIADRIRILFSKPEHIILQNRISGVFLIGAGLLLATVKRN